MRSITSAFIALALVMFSACGSEENAHSPESTRQAQVTGSFACNNGQCDSATQYCLITGPTTGGVATSSCVPKPSRTDCTGFEDDARAQFPRTINCSDAISCSIRNGQATITCTFFPRR